MVTITSDATREELATTWAQDVVRVFDVDPDLVQDLDERTARHLRHRAVASTLALESGSWRPDEWFGLAAPPGWLGLLVVDGLMTRSLCINERECPELLGAGDLLRPWQNPDSGVPVHWKVLTPTTVAILDDRFGAIAGRWPPVFARLLERSAMRAGGLAFHLALANVRQAETRLEMLFSHMAERWGRVTPAGVVLALPLTHDLIGHLACMRRPTATSALHRLMRAGRLSRSADGSWVLPHQP